MTIENLGSLGEFLGALAVFVSLIYLAIQVRQNTKTVRNSTYHEAIRDQVSGIDQLNLDSELNRIFYDGLQQFATLSREEQRRFATYLTSVLRRYEIILYQDEQGILPLDAWVGSREHLKFVFSQPGTIVWWNQAKNLFHPQLIDFIENDLTKP